VALYLAKHPAATAAALSKYHLAPLVIPAELSCAPCELAPQRPSRRSGSSPLFDHATERRIYKKPPECNAGRVTDAASFSLRLRDGAGPVPHPRFSGGFSKDFIS